MSFSTRVKIFLTTEFCLILGIMFFGLSQTQAATPQQAYFWKVTAIDTMKYSRDAAANLDTLRKVPQYVGEIAALHPNYIAIDTPYDEEFYPVLRNWVDQARKDHLHVWFRGNFSGWEGWFGYKKFSDPNEQIQLTKQFISNHPELFEDGDIFSSVPEAENGVIGDPRQNGKVSEYNSFLQNSYSICTSAFVEIHKKVDCGYFSVNGDIAKQILTPQTVAHTGNRIVIDHYIDSPEKMASDLDYLHSKFPHAKIVLGEFGAPIPDINGNMNDAEQALFIKNLLDVFVQKRSFVEGMNYWTFLGSSTALFTDSNIPKPVASVLSNYFKPPVVVGKVVDTAGNPVARVTVQNDTENLTIHTDKNGVYSFISIPNASVNLSFTKNSYDPITRSYTITNTNIALPQVILTPQNPSIFYRIKLFFRNIFKL